MSVMELLEKLSNSIRLIPALVSSVFAVLLILSGKGLPAEMKSILLPSLVVYSIGATLIGTLHRTLGFKCQTKETENCNDKTIPNKWMITIWVLHLILFGFFIFYNFRKGSL